MATVPSELLQKITEEHMQRVYNDLENPPAVLSVKCESCGKELKPLGDLQPNKFCDVCKDNEKRREFFKQQKEIVHEITPEELTGILGSTIKKDETTKLNVFLDMLLTYTENEQQNAGLIAGSCAGKSYIPLELVPYFPKEDVIKLGYASPTSFFHQWGEYIRDPRLRPLMQGEEEDEETAKTTRITVINLHQKILVFLDAPHSELLKNMRSLLSHDDKYIELNITDRSQKSGMRTRKILLVGFPTVVFCSANFLIDEQEKTRLNLYSPESSQEKISQAIAHKIHKSGNLELYEKQIAENPERQFLQTRVFDIRAMRFKNIIIPEDLQAEIDEKFKEIHKTLQARHQRDIGKLLAKIKAFTVLNYHNRKHDTNGNLEINRDDMLNGFAQYETYRESNELGLPPEAYNSFKELEEEFLSPGLTLEEYQKAHFNRHKTLLGRDKARCNLKTLTAVGLLYENPDPNDKRKVRYMWDGVGVTKKGNEDENQIVLQSEVIKETYPTPHHIYSSEVATLEAAQ